MENKGEMLQPSLIFTILSRRESLIERGGGGNLLQNLTTNKGGGLYRGVGGLSRAVLVFLGICSYNN